MDWAAVSAIAESIGVVTIFVSLIYLAMQVRQNTHQMTLSVKAAELAAFERNIESGNKIRELMITNPDLAKLYLSGAESYSGLDSSEQFRFSLLLRNMFSSTQGAYMRQLSVRDDPNDSGGIAIIIDAFLARAGVREWLAASQVDWRPEFEAFVRERLAIIEQKIATEAGD